MFLESWERFKNTQVVFRNGSRSWYHGWTTPQTGRDMKGINEFGMWITTHVSCADFWSLAQEISPVAALKALTPHLRRSATCRHGLAISVARTWWRVLDRSVAHSVAVGRPLGHQKWVSGVNTLGWSQRCHNCGRKAGAKALLLLRAM